MKKTFFILILLWVPFLGWGGARTYQHITFDQQVEGYLKQAADANTTELAEEKLSQALEGITNRGLCNHGGECFTSMFYRTPNEDVGFWRKNLEASLDDLRKMSAEQRADRLVESNQLIKLRETLLDSNHVTVPQGVSIYPFNLWYLLWVMLALSLGILGFLRAPQILHSVESSDLREQ